MWQLGIFVGDRRSKTESGLVPDIPRCAHREDAFIAAGVQHPFQKAAALIVEEIFVPSVLHKLRLFGDSIDNIPGAKGIGEKGAAELIQKYGNVENALDHAAEVPNKRYREALQQQREQVMLSKQLAKIATDVPVTLNLERLKRREP